MSAAMKVELNHPAVTLGGLQVTEIELRAPKGSDIIECGFPYVTSRHPRTGAAQEEVNAESAVRLIARCAGLMEASVLAMEAVDIYACIKILEFFFHYRTRPESSSTT